MSKGFIGITPPQFSALAAERAARNGAQGQPTAAKITIDNFGLVYTVQRNKDGGVISRRRTVALKNVSMEIPVGKVTAMLGPSGCGKSTLLRAINLVHLTNRTMECEFSGSIHVDKDPIIRSGKVVWKEAPLLRQRVGMIFQEQAVFPKSTIFFNVAYGITLTERLSKTQLDERVRATLHEVGLYDEVKDKLYGSAEALSGGQQQRLCIARTVATKPEVILMDEPTSQLDPISITIIENLIEKLQKDRQTIVIVTHNIQQAARISDYCAVLMGGELIEFGNSAQVFSTPQHPDTLNYITGRFAMEDAAADGSDLTRDSVLGRSSPPPNDVMALD